MADNGDTTGTDSGTDGKPQDGNTDGNGKDTGTTTDDGKATSGDGKPQEGKTYDEAYVKSLRDEAAKHRTSGRDALAERDKLAGVLDGLRKLIDPDSAKDADPAELVKTATTERDQARAEVKLLRVEKAATTAARKAGADVDALLDSRAFLDKLAELDPTSDRFAADVEQAVKQAIKDRPSLKATTAPTASASTDMTGGGDKDAGSGPQSIDDRIAARRKRRGIT